MSSDVGMRMVQVRSATLPELPRSSEELNNAKLPYALLQQHKKHFSFATAGEQNYGEGREGFRPVHIILEWFWE